MSRHKKDHRWIETTLTWKDARGQELKTGDIFVQANCGVSKWVVVGVCTLSQGYGMPWCKLVHKDREHIKEGYVKPETDGILKVLPEWTPSQIRLHAGICDLTLYEETTNYASQK